MDLLAHTLVDMSLPGYARDQGSVTWGKRINTGFD